MKRFKFIKLGIFILSSLLIASTALAGLPDQWTEINPAGFEYNGLTPACSNAPGTPDCEFTFFVKGGQRNNLVVFFQGGGACWDVMNCVFAPTYTQYQKEELAMFTDDMAGRGIFDQTRKDNPFKDWGFVYIPYCTGDLFWGAKDANYYGYEIQHRGFVNFQAVLQYLKENTNYPGNIFVTGSSAGSYGATMCFPYIKQSFPWSNVHLLGDAGNGITGGNFTTGGITNWNIQIPDWIFPDGYTPEMTIEQVYTDIAAAYPWSRIAQYTTAYDWNQTFFYYVMLNINNPATWETGWPAVWCDWHGQMLDYAYNTAAAAPNYRYYIAAGIDHTIMMSPKFYTEESGGTSYAAWVDSMIKTPNKWNNQECENCMAPLLCP
ncbi:MAG: pectin acetylesterase-family hydrolase [Desulfobacterales bacterium]